MTITDIGLGSTPNDGTGDDPRTAGATINANFQELDARTAGFGSETGAAADSAYVDAAGNLGVGTLAPAGSLEVEGINGNVYALLVDVDDMDAGPPDQHGLYVDVDIADYTPTDDRVHYGARVDVDAAATSTGQSAGTREYLYGARIEAAAAGDQYQSIGVYGESRHTSAANDMAVLTGGSFVADSEAASGSTTVALARGVRGLARALGAGATVTSMQAGDFEATVSGSGASVGTATAVYAGVTQSAGTLSVGYQFRGVSAGTIGTSWGIHSSGAAKSHIGGASATETPLTALASSAAFTGDALSVETNTVAGSGFDLITATADVDGTPDVVFRLRGDGQATADGSFTGGGADRAEMFEWADGNPAGEDRVGLAVVLVGDKIRAATAADAPEALIGVISARPDTIGDAEPMAWSGKYLRDPYGRPALEPFDLLEWTETVETVEVEVRRTGQSRTVQTPQRDKAGRPVLRATRQDVTAPVEVRRSSDVLRQYPADRLPRGVKPPQDARRVTHDAAGRRLTRRKLNPNFDPNAVYVPRVERPEWSPVGVVGKVPLRAGQPTAPAWRKLKDLGPGVALWLIR